METTTVTVVTKLSLSLLGLVAAGIDPSPSHVPDEEQFYVLTRRRLHICIRLSTEENHPYPVLLYSSVYFKGFVFQLKSKYKSIQITRRKLMMTRTKRVQCYSWRSIQMPSKVKCSPAGLKDNSCLLTPPLTCPCQPTAPSPRVLAWTSQSSVALPLALESMQRSLHQ